MKFQPTTISLLITGAFFLCGPLGRTTQAQTLLNGTNTLGSSDAPAVAADDVSVAYTVTQSGDVYTYDYTVYAPGSASVSSFNIGFNASSANANSVSGGLLGQEIDGIGVDWFLSVPTGGNSGTLSFQSDEAPGWGNANANGNPSAPAPWASTSSGGEQLPMPIPEPATSSLLAMALLALPFQFKRHNIERKED
ncbi:MAG: hypothetical protein ABSA83_01780 [Verrucomicrobiota bacterium]|jgi:hypothetical protein